MITEASQARCCLNQNGVFIVRCGFNDWELGIEWQSVHVFLSQKEELVLRLFGLSEEYSEEGYDMNLYELLEDQLMQDYSQEELVDALLRHLKNTYRENTSFTLKLSSLEVQREHIIQTGEKRTEQQDIYENWYTIEDTLETDNLDDFLNALVPNFSLIPGVDVPALAELCEIKSGFFQDGIALDVDPTDVTPFGMCWARVNLSSASRMDLNITRHQIDEAHDTIDVWLARVGTVIQSRIAAQLKDVFQTWGFEGDITSLCTDKHSVNEYFGKQSLRQIQRNIR